MTLRRLMTRLQDPDNAPAGGSSAAPATTAPAAPAAPASTPSAAPAASGAAGDSSGSSSAPDDAFDFGALADYASGKEPVVSTEPPTAVVPAAPAPSPAPPAAPAAAAPVVPAPPAPPPAPTEPQGTPPAATATTPASSEQPPQQVDWAKHKAEFLPKLEQQYAMSDQEIQDFQTNPGQALPKLAAQLHYNVTLAMQSAIREYLPHVVQQHAQLQETRTKYETAFYGKWPALKAAREANPNVEATINEAIKAYGITNPKATIAEVIDKVGLLAMISLGIDPRQGAPAAPAAAPAAPQIIPGRPAGTGGQGHVPPRASVDPNAPQTDDDLYGGIAQHIMGGG